MNSRDRWGWLNDAACRDHPGWDSDSGGDYKPLLRVCRGCPVRAPCLLTALEFDDDGIRGGLLPTQRSKLRRDRRRNRAADAGRTDQYIAMVDGRKPAGFAGLSREGEFGSRVMAYVDDLPSPNPVPKGRR